ncbi:MAG: ABC transporter ATP-binding protein [Candidatus Nanopelagicaceae bacterium]|nr:ABC transporter ATP-binding protein [Candidatus Nanopelagicaceae bacterium]
MKIVDVQNLSVQTIDGSKVVSDVSFSVEPGARLGLIGESGSGKSMTALAIMGLLPAELKASGSLLLGNGKEEPVQILGSPEKMLNRIRGTVASIVFQEPLTALDPLMKIGRQLSEPLRRWQGLTGDALKDAVLSALDEVRINKPERIATSYPYEISGGERQRAAIAMALACEPALLIADEPTTALDVTVQAEILTLLDAVVSNRGMSLLFISHDLAVVSRITDRVLVMKDGLVVESGSLRNVLRDPQHPYTRDLVTSAKELDNALDIALDAEKGTGIGENDDFANS